MFDSCNKDKEISVMANAIGYIVFGGDPHATDEDTQITVTSEQVELAHLAALRAWEHLEDYREECWNAN